ncbi:MAG: Crp/Fnr family transcriptional regulator, partial [Gammaproteobacteria bacterium]|nr:Crp/Fnr family transcriptional regulator [Gammaproteobacteria bacterium]
MRGSVRVQLLTESGREVLLYRVGSGGSCVLTTSCLMSGERYPAAAVTENEVEAVVVERALFDTTMQHWPDFRRFVLKSFGRRLGQVIARMDEVAFGPVGRRLAQLLESKAPVAHTTHQELA